LARISALSHKAKENSISIVEDFQFDAPKTKEYRNMLNSLLLNDKKTLLVLPQNDDNIYLSSRNLQKTKVTTADRINTYDLVNADSIVFLESSLEKVEQLLIK
jgi:large subunit ribosomal protein L4